MIQAYSIGLRNIVYLLNTAAIRIYAETIDAKTKTHIADRRAIVLKLRVGFRLGSSLGLAYSK